MANTNAHTHIDLLILETKRKNKRGKTEEKDNNIKLLPQCATLRILSKGNEVFINWKKQQENKSLEMTGKTGT